MEKIKLYASDHRALSMKIQDSINQYGEYDHLTIEKKNSDLWQAEIIHKERPLYIGLRRADTGG